MEYDSENADRLGARCSPDGIFLCPGGKETPLTGRMHSLESMGLVDGPGVRAVVFLQGCPLRCRYCHNPDTQAVTGGTEITAEELTRRLLRFRPYFAGGGGVTFSGGEPLMQPEFLAEMLRRLQENGIHTCLDTAGAGRGDYEAILAHTDLVLFDVKHEDPDGYQALTGGDIRQPRAFVDAVGRQPCGIISKHFPGWSGSSCSPITPWAWANMPHWAVPIPSPESRKWTRPAAPRWNSSGSLRGTAVFECVFRHPQISMDETTT